MRYLISGASGLVGSYLVEHLAQAGHKVEALSRQPGAENYWQPDTGHIQLADRAFDVVIHLSGESIAQGRWNSSKKQLIVNSRIQSTQLLAQTLSQLKVPPKSFICASGVGFYGDCGSSLLTEDSPNGSDFLAQLARDWEAACKPASAAGIRVINTRLGMVASTRGGGLGQMLLPFKLGLGGPVGSGEQYMPWLSLPELANIIDFCVDHESIRGVVNCVTPTPLTNRVFAQTLAQQLHRPCRFAMPAVMARLGFGEMADAVLLSSLKVMPKKLEAAGYRFIHADLAAALDDLFQYRL